MQNRTLPSSMYLVGFAGTPPTSSEPQNVKTLVSNLNLEVANAELTSSLDKNSCRKCSTARSTSSMYRLQFAGAPLTSSASTSAPHAWSWICNRSASMRSTIARKSGVTASEATV